MVFSPVSFCFVQLRQFYSLTFFIFEVVKLCRVKNCLRIIYDTGSMALSLCLITRGCSSRKWMKKPQKRKKKSTYRIMIPLVKLFSFDFWKNWGYKKVLLKLHNWLLDCFYALPHFGRKQLSKCASFCSSKLRINVTIR